MSLFLLSLAVAGLASVAGGIIATVVARLPLPVLARASVGGRYAGLGVHDQPSPATPARGRPIGPVAGAAGFAS